MPSESQLTLIHTVSTTTQGKGSSDTARLKSSYDRHEHSVVKAAPAATYDTGLDEETASVTLSSLDADATSLKNFYVSHVLRGTKNIEGSGWPALGEAGSGGVDLSYGESPVLGALGPVPEGEEAPGGAANLGSTIVSSGLGPNVNISGDIATRKVVDASPDSDTPFTGDGSASPSTTSAEIAGATSLPPSTLGHSPSS